MKAFKKSILLLTLAAGLLLTACGKGTDKDSTSPADTGKDTQESQTEADSTADNTADNTTDNTTIRVGGLKGPTTMGMAKLLSDSKKEDANLSIEYTLAAAADELTPSLIKGDLDMLAVPSNLASVLYNNTEGKVQIIAVNTLGVLYIVDTGDSVKKIADLKGKTILATGQGNTPEYTLKFLLSKNGLDPEKDVTIEWKSEPTEIVAAMKSGSNEVIAMLPQPFVTVAQTQVEGLNIVVNLNDEWGKTDAGSGIVTGVMIARTDFVKEHPQLVKDFLKEYEASIKYVNENVDDASTMIEELDIVKAPIAKKAIPYCNLRFMEGDEMKTAVSGYLKVLYDQNPKSVGGKLPDDAFYYKK